MDEKIAQEVLDELFPALSRPSGCRKLQCVSRITIQTKNMPATAVPYSSKNALCGARTASRMAISIPEVDKASARSGTPFLLSRPSQSGANLPRESEYSIRVERYKLVFALEIAAVITTRFIMLAAKGIPAAVNARTNGLAVTPPLPSSFQGFIATVIEMART